MKRIRIVLVACVAGLGASAHGATLSVVPDKPTYLVGETISLTVTGNSQGGADNAIRGQLQYSSALTNTTASTQTTHTTGGLPWIPILLLRSDGQADVFNQTRVLPGTVDQLQIATATLIAQAVGVVSVTWTTSGGAALDFFGLTSAPGATFSIVPEPDSALLVAAGLSALACAGRRR